MSVTFLRNLPPMTREEFVSRIRVVEDGRRVIVAVPPDPPFATNWASEDIPDLNCIEAQLEDPADIAWWQQMVGKACPLVKLCINNGDYPLTTRNP